MSKKYGPLVKDMIDRDLGRPDIPDYLKRILPEEISPGEAIALCALNDKSRHLHADQIRGHLADFVHYWSESDESHERTVLDIVQRAGAQTALIPSRDFDPKT